MLVALLTIMILGGGGSGLFDYIDEASDTVKEVIVNDEQRDAVKASFKSMKKRMKDHDKQLKTISKSLEAELGDHQAGNAEIDETWDQFYVMNSQYTEDMIDLRFELKSHVSSEEWEQMFPQK